jgi:hypothetical protein
MSRWTWEFECNQCGGVGRTTVRESVLDGEGGFYTEKECTNCDFSALFGPGEVE